MRVVEQGRRRQTDDVCDHAAHACRDLPFLTRSLAAVALCLAVSACVPETSSVSISPPKGASAEQAFREFAIVVALAETIDEFCRSYGIRKTYGNADQLTFDYAQKLKEKGYSQAELARAASPLARQVATEEALRTLAAGGVREDDVASLCRYGKEEIAKGTPTGKLLRLTR